MKTAKEQIRGCRRGDRRRLLPQLKMIVLLPELANISLIVFGIVRPHSPQIGSEQKNIHRLARVFLWKDIYVVDAL